MRTDAVVSDCRHVAVKTLRCKPGWVVDSDGLPEHLDERPFSGFSMMLPTAVDVRYCPEERQVCLLAACTDTVFVPFLLESIHVIKLVSESLMISQSVSCNSFLVLSVPLSIAGCDALFILLSIIGFSDCDALFILLSISSLPNCDALLVILPIRCQVGSPV